MPEQLDLTVPIIQPQRLSYLITLMVLDWAAPAIIIRLLGSDNVEVRAEYAGNTALTLLSALNTANLSTASLHKRVLQRLVADGKLPAGAVSGVPQ